MNRLLWNSLLAFLLQATQCQKLNPVLPFEPDPREFCESQVFEPHCPPGHVVMITEARYGRMQIGRCVETDYGYLGCQSDVLQHLDYACSGRQNCTMRVPDHVLDKTNHSCPKEFKTYLNVSHKCIPVVSDACYSCAITQQARVTQSSGYIASATTAAASLTSGQPCGSARCPWRIEVESGQTIELTLYDFSMEDRQALYTAGLVGGGEYGGSCYRYAIIKEEMSLRDTPICGGRGRTRVIYSSVTNILEIHVVSPEAFIKLGHFVVHYQAIGCADYVAPSNEWVKRHGMTLKIGCQNTDDVWELKCNDTLWTGAGKSCPDLWFDPTPTASTSSLSGGLLISIVIGIAFVVAVFIVTVGVVCLKRQRGMLPPCPEQYYDQRSLQQYYEMREDFRTIEIPASTIRKPCSAMRQPKTQQPLTFRNTPAGRRNLYGAPRMDKRPLPSLPNIVETCSLDSPSSETLNAFGGVRRTVQADINTGERSASTPVWAPGVVLQSGKARHTPVSTGTSSQVSGSARNAGTSNISSQQSGPQTTGCASACTAFSSPYLPPQHYTVLDPIEVRLMTGNSPHVSGCSGVQPGSCPIATNATPDCAGLQGENSACAQSYRSHSDDGSTSGSSEEAHLHNSSCHEIPLRPMREGSQPAPEPNNSGNCSWP